MRLFRLTSAASLLLLMSVRGREARRDHWAAFQLIGDWR